MVKPNRMVYYRDTTNQIIEKSSKDLRKKVLIPGLFGNRHVIEFLAVKMQATLHDGLIRGVLMEQD